MKKTSKRHAEGKETMRRVYFFKSGVRGKHHHALQSGYTITIHNTDGTTTVQEIEPPKGAVILAPDVYKYFPDSESVNNTLRSLIRLVPAQAKSGVKKRGT